MKQYLIKATYLTGRHAGETYYMTKGGYVANYNENTGFWYGDTYETLKVCKAVCTRMAKNNKLDHELELSRCIYNRDNKGKEFDPDNLIYELESYEPFEIDQ